MKIELVELQDLVHPIHEAARALHDAAVNLEWNKNRFPPHLRMQAINVEREMRKLADALEAAGKIPPSPPFAKGGAQGENETAGPGWASVTGGLS